VHAVPGDADGSTKLGPLRTFDGQGSGHGDATGCG